jgi:hypothetical protein
MEGDSNQCMDPRLVDPGELRVVSSRPHRAANWKCRKLYSRIIYDVTVDVNRSQRRRGWTWT